MIINEFTTVTFFSYGMCNLNCTYCTIDKNLALKEVDDLLAESYENYQEYLDRIDKYLPNPYQLRRIETWGGEPSYGWERMIPMIHKLIETKPNFNNFFSSTNFSYPEWSDNVLRLLDVFASYPTRKFVIDLQFSCDGPAYINDVNRGIGVTKRCFENLELLLNKLQDKDYQNLELHFYTKPTLNIENIKHLQTKEAIIDYYQFFDTEFISRIISKNIPYIQVNSSKPKIAVPTPASIEDGKDFANFNKLCEELEKEADKYFTYYRDLVLFKGQGQPQMCVRGSDVAQCGTGLLMLCLLPHNLYCTCYMTFADMCDNYKKFKKEHPEKTINIKGFLEQSMPKGVMTEEKYDEFIQHMHDQNGTVGMARLNRIISDIIVLSRAGQIDAKYQRPSKAFVAAEYIANTFSYCITDNIASTGSMLASDLGTYKEILNGAEKYLYEMNEEDNS